MGEEVAVDPGLCAKEKAARPKTWRKRDSRQSLVCTKTLGLGGAGKSKTADGGHYGWRARSDMKVDGK